MAGWLVAASAADLEPFRAYLARRRVAHRGTLVQALRGARLRRLREHWAGELSAPARLDVSRTTPPGRQAPWHTTSPATTWPSPGSRPNGRS